MKISSIPRQPELSIEEQTALWYVNPLKLLQNCQRDFGSAFTLELKNIGKHVVFTDPGIVKSIYQSSSKSLYGGGDKEFMRPLLGEYSLFLLQGQQHRQWRLNLNAFFSKKNIAQYQTLIKSTCEKTIKQWKLDSTISILKSSMDISREIICSLIFGLADDKKSTAIKNILVSILDDLKSFGIFSTVNDEASPLFILQNRFYEKKKKLDELLFDFIDETKKQATKTQEQSLLSFMLSQRDEDDKPYSNQMLRDQLITLLIAGHETTATAVAWASYWILKDKRIKELLLKGNDLEFQSSEYLKACCQESLRIIPTIAMISRTLVAPMSIDEFVLPKGVHVSVPIYLLHNNDKLFENPTTFYPERFLKRHYKINEFMPFGGGTRICIGQHLALLQMQIMLATIFERFDLELNKNYVVKPIRRSVIISPAHGVMVNVKKRY